MKSIAGFLTPSKIANLDDQNILSRINLLKCRLGWQYADYAPYDLVPANYSDQAN